jgi:hypothetical protein
LTNNPKSADKRQSQENKKKVKWSAESDGGGGRTTFFDFVWGGFFLLFLSLERITTDEFRQIAE